MMSLLIFLLLFCFSLKVSWFRKQIVKQQILPKNEQMNSFLLLCEVFSFVFWKKLKTPKQHFEIIWPLARMGTILIKPNITTLFDPCQTFWWRVYENAHFSPKNLIPNRPHYSIGPYKPTQLNANQKKKEKFCKSKKFLSKQLLDARCYASTAH